MTTDVLFIEAMLQQVPELQAIYDEHLNNNEELLSHVFMGDVTRFFIKRASNPQQRTSLTALLQHLEDGLRTGSEEVKELILASFVENLPGETRTSKVIKPLMGKKLTTAVESVCE